MDQPSSVASQPSSTKPRRVATLEEVEFAANVVNLNMTLYMLVMYYI
jgi:hypothetical protein